MPVMRFRWVVICYTELWVACLASGLNQFLMDDDFLKDQDIYDTNFDTEIPRYRQKREQSESPKKNQTVIPKVEHAKRLFTDLLSPKNYNRHIRPVRDYDKPIVITVALNLYQILNVNERDENILLYMWTKQFWDDAHLGWHPSEYGGINWTIFPHQHLWTPDTCVYNSIHAKERLINMLATTSAIDANFTGEPVAHIRFMYPALYQFSCNLEVKHFPFDRQNCTMIFGSWTLDGGAIVYEPELDTVRFETYVPNEEWSVISFEVVKRSNYYTCCPHPYTELHAHLVIQRKPLYYIVNLVIPIIIIAVIAAFGFFTPVSSGGERTERVELGVNTLLAMSILLVIVADQMPTTSNSIPLISWFYMVNIILIAVGTVLSSVVMIIQQQGHYGRQVPESLRHVFFTYIGPCLGICPIKTWRKELQRRKTRYMSHHRLSSDYAGTNCVNQAPESGSDPDSAPLISRTVGVAHKNALAFTLGANSGLTPEATLLKEIRIIKKILYSLQETADLDERDRAIKMEWEYFSVILDRALLLIFMSLLISFIAVFFSYGFSLWEHEDDPAAIYWKESLD